MTHYLSNLDAQPISVGIVRFCALGSLVAYPAGALTLALASDTLYTTIIGFGLIVLSLILAIVVGATNLQRLVGEGPAKLDEYELQLRYRAFAASYSILALLALLASIYLAIASDKGGWVPTTYDEWNGVFWGVMLYAVMLPAAVLAWQSDARSVLDTPE